MFSQEGVCEHNFVGKTNGRFESKYIVLRKG
jgi:hypothetical protein